MPLIEAAKRYGSVKHGFMRCPFHADRTPSLKLYGDHFHCFGCGAHGDVIDLTAALIGCSQAEAARRLEANFGSGGFVPPLGLAACKRELSRCRESLAPKSRICILFAYYTINNPEAQSSGFGVEKKDKYNAMDVLRLC